MRPCLPPEPVLPTPAPTVPRETTPIDLLGLPDLLEEATRCAAKRLPAGKVTPLLLHRLNALLQDAVESAVICSRAHIEAPLVAKHLLGADQYQTFLGASDEAATAVSSEIDQDDFAAAVTGTVGLVRA